MITRYSHANVWVMDQDEALAFSTEKLGLQIRTDVTMDGFRWLTVGANEQPDVKLILVEPGPPIVDEEAAQHIRALVRKGAMGAWFYATDDCRATFAELSAKGVEFVQEPAERPYGVEAIFRDNSGNWFSLTQAHHDRRRNDGERT